MDAPRPRPPLPDVVPLTVDFSIGFYFHREVPAWSSAAGSRRSRALLAAGTRRLPMLDELPIQSSWWGYYEMSPDHNAIVGEATEPSRFLYAIGFSGPASAARRSASTSPSGVIGAKDCLLRLRQAFLHGRAREEAFVICLPGVRLFVFARHGESVLNSERRINGDLSVDVPLTEEGLQAHRLGVEIANIGFDLCLHAPRTRETADRARRAPRPPGGAAPRRHRCRRPRGRDARGISRLEALARARGSLPRRGKPGRRGASVRACPTPPAGSPARHRARRHARDPDRYALNGASGSDSLDGPAHEVENAVAYLFDDEALARAADGIETIVAG